ncbi:hypothetical protein [Peptostreptococcus faecalis]|uniref:hypothetical protein n=1 Tax=Peptostreptococcus faecalis TaxID=2045015 RepID=UPI000C7C53C6|nr:hypothetical protein [Peptostreptococcus faecalis]
MKSKSKKVIAVILGVVIVYCATMYVTSDYVGFGETALKGNEEKVKKEGGTRWYLFKNFNK